MDLIITYSPTAAHFFDESEPEPNRLPRSDPEEPPDTGRWMKPTSSCGLVTHLYEKLRQDPEQHSDDVRHCRSMKIG